MSAELGEQTWFMDDEKAAYPFWEKTKTPGVKNLCVHKGLPLGFFKESQAHRAASATMIRNLVAGQ